MTDKDKDKDDTKAPPHASKEFKKARSNISDMAKKRTHVDAQRKLRSDATSGVKSGN